MPSLDNCLKDAKGNTWCFDPETGMVCRIKFDYPDQKTVPQGILLDLLKEESRRRRGRK